LQAGSPRAAQGFTLPLPEAVQAKAAALAASGFTTVQTPVVKVTCHGILITCIAAA